MPAEMAGLPAWAWFDLGYFVSAWVLFILWKRHSRQPLPIVPESWLGKGQLFYLGLLWLLVVGNFERALVAFRAERLVTEGVLYLVALACTIVLLLARAQSGDSSNERPAPRAARRRPGLATVAAVGLVAATVSIVADWAIVRAIYGDNFAGHSRLHIRFGPRATTNQP